MEIMFDFDLAAIGFEHVGILHGHRFSSFGDSGETIYCFSIDTCLVLGPQLARPSRRPFFFSINFFYEHIGIPKKSLLKDRPSTHTHTSTLGSEQHYEPPGHRPKADI
jgi:hypothetical protein